MINDVSGGLLDDAMLTTAAALDVPICLMHYRGDPSTMARAPNPRHCTAFRVLRQCAGDPVWAPSRFAIP